MSSGEVVIVTGAAGGIGSETVRILLEGLNCKVVACDINSGSKLSDLQKKHGNSLEVVVGDITDPKTSEKLVQMALTKFGKLDGLALLAGVFGPCYRLEQSDPEAWIKAFRVNTFSHLYTDKLRFALPELRRTKGRVVAATSGAGHGALFSGWGFYGMSKSAVAFNISQLALEEPEIIAVGISPGLCDTPMIASLIQGANEGQTTEDVLRYKEFVKQVPLITPTVAGDAFARTVTTAGSELSGLVVDYNDSRLPIAEEAKDKSAKGSQDYTKFT